MTPPYIPASELAELTGDRGAVLPFCRPLPAPHNCSYVYGHVLKVLETGENLQEAFTVKHVTQNHTDGRYTAHVQIAGDSNVYELTLKPVGRAGA